MNIQIRLGDCDCFTLYKIPHVCWKDDKRIYLVAEKKDFDWITDLIETCLNHEVIHLIIDELEGRIPAKKFDNVFDKTKEIVTREDGTPT